MGKLSLKHEQAMCAEATAQTVICPKCNARLEFCRSQTPRIDECGFETVTIACGDCGTLLAGVIDPADEALLLSPVPA